MKIVDLRELNLPASPSVIVIQQSKLEAKMDTMLQRLDALSNGGTHHPKTSFTMDQLRALHLKVSSENESIKADVSRWQHLVNHFGADTQIADVTTEQVLAFREQMKVGRKPATVNKIMALMKRAFNIAKEQKHRHQDPMIHVKKLREDNERNRICTMDELKLLRSSCIGDLRLLIILGFFTGMRQGELANLTWEDVELDKGLLRARSKKTGRRQKVAVRYVPLSDEAIAELRRIQPADRKAKLFSKTAGDFSRDFGKLVKQIRQVEPDKLESLTFHDLRHTALSNYRLAGVDMFALMKISGHASMNMLKRYINVDQSEMVDAAQKLNTYHAAIQATV